jgi:hypothetical protein
MPVSELKKTDFPTFGLPVRTILEVPCMSKFPAFWVLLPLVGTEPGAQLFLLFVP